MATQLDDTTTFHDSELLALAGLVRLLVEMDDDITSDEDDELALIAKQVGEERFSAAMESAGAADPKPLDACAAAITRRPAQELAYSLLEELAASDGIEPEQADWLSELRETWGIRE